MKIRNNTLYQYKGGGYDGCVFEWNYAVVNDAGEFIDIFSSGHGGCDSIEKLEQYNAEAFGNGAYFYDLGNVDELKFFAESSNAGHVVGVARKLFEELDIEIPGTCYECEAEVPIHMMYASGSQGAGGVAVEYTTMVCQQCRYREEEEYQEKN